MSDLSAIGEAIRHYKLNSGGGYTEWSKVPCTDDYKMHVPSMGFNTVGPIENGKILFRWLTDIEATQELVNLVEFGSYITCYLKRSDKGGGVLDVVEVFKTDDTGKVKRFGPFKHQPFRRIKKGGQMTSFITAAVNALLLAH